MKKKKFVAFLSYETYVADAKRIGHLGINILPGASTRDTFVEMWESAAKDEGVPPNALVVTFFNIMPAVVGD